jgi:hypothetical protein
MVLEHPLWAGDFTIPYKPLLWQLARGVGAHCGMKKDIIVHTWTALAFTAALNLNTPLIACSDDYIAGCPCWPAGWCAKINSGL